MMNNRISTNGKSKSHYITVEKADEEAALEGESRQDVSDVNAARLRIGRAGKRRCGIM